ncbi:MAG: hypothetical protein Q7T61_18090 [Caulobacter sp.]|nr:hypothetical protein [Caulobacter sp.]
MPHAPTARAADPAGELLELTTGLTAIVAGVLWFWVYLIATGDSGLCTSTPLQLSHCPLCYPAVFATLGAMISGGLLLSRRQAT